MTELRALLLTDVVDSTQLSERLGDQAMASVWAAHDRVARDLLPAWRGREIDKTDGMLLLFGEAADAVQYALAYHRALGQLPVPLRARAGLHVGPVILRENHAADVARGAKPLEVDGLAKPTAARVMSLARGAQTLLTPEAHDALADWLAGSTLHSRSHGHWVLKGVLAPVELFEIGDDPAAFAAPPDGDKVYRVVRVGERWLPVRQIANNLPEQPSSFIGRERELAELKVLLGETRLLTLLGMGGLGKTRLSLQVAAELMADYPDGVWFLDLAPLRDGALVVSEAAQTLGVREEPGRPLLQTLCAHLKASRVLVILDNCEHLLRPAAQLAHALLRAARQVTIIASSREALRVPGERAYPILPLPVPSRHDSLETLSRSTAVRLFIERAQEHRIDFTLTQAEAPAVAELVARLEGIPLALELAAARVRSMTLADINRGLADRYKVLTGGSFALEERQQTLRALVDWSYDILNPAEQTTLRRLAVFAGGFDLAAAEPVGDGAPVSLGAVSELLASLVEKSLIGMEHRDGLARYRMLETIRDYAAEKLHGSGDAAATAARHCAHFFVVAKAARVGLRGPRQGEWLDRLDTEHDNLRGAMQVALTGRADADADPFVAVKLAVALQNFWIMRGHAGEGRAAIQAMLAQPAVLAADMAKAHALYVGAALAYSQSDAAEALRMLLDCLALRRGLANPADIAATLSTLAVTKLSSGDASGALAASTEALELFRQCGDRPSEAIALLQLGQVEAYQGRHAEALQHLSQSLAIAREIKHPETEGEAELVLGELALSADDPGTAEQDFARSLAVCEAAGDRRGTANALAALSRIDLLASRLGMAGCRMHEALRAFDRFEMRAQWLACLEDHAALALRQGPLALAVGLAAAANRLRDSAQLIRSPQAQRRWERLLADLQAACGDDEFISAWEPAHGWDSAEAQRRALGLTRAPAPAPAA